jgi:hypothetical protein
MNAASRKADQFIVRLPDGLRDELKTLARARHRSMNGQVVVMIERGLAAEKAALGQPAS